MTYQCVNRDDGAMELPCGGIQHSGHGRERSSMGIQECVNNKPARVAAIDAPASASLRVVRLAA